MPKAVALLSGGLDSQLAIMLMLRQGVEVEAITSASVFHHATADLGDEHPAARAARRLGVPHMLLDTNDEMLAMVKSPAHGRGKNMNPCIDCRIFLFKKAAWHMRERGADFIVTGEVIGQRPMSQRRHAIEHIDRVAGVQGLVVRPLCGKLLDPTRAEEAGLIDREKLLAIRGRSRKEQIALAAKLGLTDYPTPAGGCLLTDPGFARRLRELLDRGDPDLNDIRLLRFGRHFRLDADTKLVVGRDERENAEIEKLARDGDLLLDAADVAGPTALLRRRAPDQNAPTGLAASHGAAPDDPNVVAAASLTLRYGKAQNEPSARVMVRKARTAESFELIVAPAPAACPHPGPCSGPMV